jgi:hypothetical protein
LVDKKTIVCLGDPISGLEKTSPFQSIASTYVLDDQADVPGKLLAKVVRIYDQAGPYPTGKGPRIKYACQIKDIDGSKQSINFWRSVAGACPIELNQVYIFKNLKATKYRGEISLVCDKDYDLMVAPTEQQEYLREITYYDGAYKGKVVAINRSRTFKSCDNCWRSTDTIVGQKCPKCKKILREIIDDFSFSVVIVNGNDFLTLTCFKRLVSFQGPSIDTDSIEMEVMKLLDGKMVEGVYLEKKYKDTEGANLMMHTMTIL